MPSVYRKGGQVLKRDGKVAIAEACCCPACCGTPCSSVLMTLQNVADCPCADGCTIQLDWNAVTSCFEGQGECGGCALGTTAWTLCCCTNADPELGPCFDYCLTYLDNNACVLTTDPLFPNTCSCDPFELSFLDVPLSGIGCCDSMTGAGTINILITCLPAMLAGIPDSVKSFLNG